MQFRGGRSRRAVAIAAAAVVAIGGVACGERARAGTSGDRHDACRGLAFYDALDEPDPADLDAVAQWADDAHAILKQISFRQRYRDRSGEERTVPKQVQADVAILRAAIERFRERVGEADGDNPAAALETVRAADRALFTDAAATEAGRRLQEFAATECA